MKFTRKLIAEGVFDEAGARQVGDDRLIYLDDEFEAGTSYRPNKADWLEKLVKHAQGAWVERRGETAVELDVLRRIGKTITTPPEHMTSIQN